MNLICVNCSGGIITALISTPELYKVKLLEVHEIISYPAMYSSLNSAWLT